MSIQVNNNQSGYDSKVYELLNNNQTADVKEEQNNTTSGTQDPAYIVDRSDDTDKSFSVDMNAIKALKADFNKSYSAFQQMISVLFQKQGKAFNTANELADILNGNNIKSRLSSLEVDEDTRTQAAALVAGDGYFGIEQTANRILDFAKALSGSDPSKISLLKESVEKGFNQAQEKWGDTLPDICQKTYDRVMQGFDDWENSLVNN